MDNREWTTEGLKKLMQQSEMETRREIAESFGLDKAMTEGLDILKNRFTLLGADFDEDCRGPAADIGEIVDVFKRAIKTTRETLELKEQARQAQAVMDAGHKFKTIQFGNAIFSPTDDGLVLRGHCSGCHHCGDDNSIPF